jgi:hypothetical protein
VGKSWVRLAVRYGQSRAPNVGQVVEIGLVTISRSMKMNTSIATHVGDTNILQRGHA